MVFKSTPISSDTSRDLTMIPRWVNGLMASGALVLLAGLQWSKLQTLPDQSFDNRSEGLYLNSLRYLPTLGFQNLIADGVFLQFLQYFGDDTARQQTGYQLSPDFFEISVPKDPYFIDQYIFLSASATLYAARPEASVALMEKGLQSLSPDAPDRAYLVWRYKGTDELLFLGDSEAAEQSFRTAADWAKQSPDPQAQFIAEISEQTANFLARNPSSKFAQINAWVGVFTNALDDYSRQLAQQRIEALGGTLEIKPDGGIKIAYPEED
jgi:hypothetical protein